MVTGLPKRHGIRAVILIAEQAISDQAEVNLSPQRFEELRSAAGNLLFVAGNYPGPEWEAVVGFVPAQELYYQVIVGIAVDPGQPINLFAQALISRDVSAPFCHIVWEPIRK